MTITYGAYQYKLFEDRQKALDFIEADDVNLLTFEENCGKYVVFFQYIYKTYPKKTEYRWEDEDPYAFASDDDDVNWEWTWDSYNKEWVKTIHRGPAYYRNFNWGDA